MIRPAHFGFNPETADNNVFQDNSGTMTSPEISVAAREEFDDFVSRLRAKKINVIVYEDTEVPHKTDAIFPNNWITTHFNSVIITYPMFSPNRRQERRTDIVEDLKTRFGFERQYFFEHYEEEGKFLEGTGSMILDRDNKVVFACLSERTDVELLEKFAVLMSFKKIFFHAVDPDGVPIYHTNVMMALGEDFCIICLEAIPDEEERSEVVAQLSQNDKEVIAITIGQMYQYAGNMIQLKNTDGERFLVMSEQAYKSLNSSQIERITAYCEIISIPLYTIEKYGGGSARCMIAEVFQ